MLLSEIARDRGIRYFLISFIDLFGTQRAKMEPAQAIDRMSVDGVGFAAWLDMTPADPGILAIPDASQMIQLPWQPEVAWLPADVLTIPQSGGFAHHRQPLVQTPRLVLKRLLEQSAARGYRVKTGVECEYFLLSADSDRIFDERDRSVKPCYDQQSLMRRFDIIAEICDAMLTMGWGAYQNDHEDANGQFEMNWMYADALVTADRHAFFKYMVKSIAEKHGMRATFMPKPFMHLTGNGCHTHLSIWDTTGNVNLFDDPAGKLGLSTLGYQFIGGVLAATPALCALTNPVVNSYKRLNALVTTSGATWSPNGVSYSGNNRTHTIRIPDAGRFEFRLADGAANPYLLPAALIAAGLDGIDRKLDPGAPCTNNNYTDPLPNKTTCQLPGNLLDALRNLEANEGLKQSMGADFISAYVKLKHQEWQDYCTRVSSWELEHTLDC
jgi:glutamine synthetase type III